MAILYEKKDKIASITINRPEAMNAMDPDTYREISEALIDVGSDPEVWVAIITGTGDKAFSAGADLKRMHQGGGESSMATIWNPTKVPRFDQGFQIWKPVIAAVNGYCLAGGFELAMACDIRIASEHASFGAPEVRWSILHGYGALRLPKAIPLSSAMEILLLGDRIDAQEAYRIGIVSRVVPHKELIPTAEKMARRICENGPLAVRATKEIAIRGMNTTLDEGLRLYALLNRMIHETEDAREGPRAFVEKRPPQFKGR